MTDLRPILRCNIAVAVALTLLAVAPKGSLASGNRPARCGRRHGLPVLAYNMSCSRARRVMRHLPSGWTGANLDVPVGRGLPPGVAILYREREAGRVNASLDRRNGDRPFIRRLRGAPVVWFAEPYGE